MIKVALVVGTRPEAIKMAPIALRLKRTSGMKPILILTAQHRKMCDDVLEVFGLKPDYDLDIMRPNQSLFEVTARLSQKLEPVLTASKPDIVLVQGDTTSTFMGSLCSYYLKIPVGHVEAGLRTYEKYSPFPEEINRRLTSAIADLHFAPTSVAADALIAEGVDPRRIFVVGNPVIDALLYATSQDHRFENKVLSAIDFTSKKVIVVTAHRRESHGKPFVNMMKAIKRIAEDNKDVLIVYPVHPNPNVITPARKILGNAKRVKLINPLDYSQFTNLLKSCYLIITDSGGIQEEAPSLGKPVLLMRNVTERPEAVKAGAVRVVGTDPRRIVSECRRLIDYPDEYSKMVIKRNPYGDGRAAERIVNILRRYLSQKS